ARYKAVATEVAAEPDVAAIAPAELRKRLNERCEADLPFAVVLRIAEHDRYPPHPLLRLEGQRCGEQQKGHCDEPGPRESHGDPPAMGDPKGGACPVIAYAITCPPSAALSGRREQRERRAPVHARS